jgi:YD repeat-containing protein
VRGDGGVTTIGYSGGLLSTIQTVGGRTYTMAYSGANLASVTDPGGGVESFTYDASHRVLTEAFANLSNGWSYGAGGDWRRTPGAGPAAPASRRCCPSSPRG